MVNPLLAATNTSSIREGGGDWRKGICGTWRYLNLGITSPYFTSAMRVEYQIRDLYAKYHHLVTVSFQFDVTARGRIFRSLIISVTSCIVFQFNTEKLPNWTETTALISYERPNINIQPHCHLIIKCLENEAIPYQDKWRSPQHQLISTLRVTIHYAALL